jgi:hypothetical protein
MLSLFNRDRGLTFFHGLWTRCGSRSRTWGIMYTMYVHRNRITNAVYLETCFQQVDHPRSIHCDSQTSSLKFIPMSYNPRLPRGDPSSPSGNVDSVIALSSPISSSRARWFLRSAARCSKYYLVSCATRAPVAASQTGCFSTAGSPPSRCTRNALSYAAPSPSMPLPLVLHVPHAVLVLVRG